VCRGQSLGGPTIPLSPFGAFPAVTCCLIREERGAWPVFPHCHSFPPICPVNKTYNQSWLGCLAKFSKVAVLPKYSSVNCFSFYVFFMLLEKGFWAVLISHPRSPGWSDAAIPFQQISPPHNLGPRRVSSDRNPRAGREIYLTQPPP